MRRKRALLIAIALILAFTGLLPSASFGLAPYESYTYNYYEDAVPLPAPFLPEKAVTGLDLGVGPFKDPSDMFVTSDGYVYILDSGNNRVIALDPDWKVIRIIEKFTRDGAEDGFSSPSGIFVSDGAKNIYVADTNNKRVVVLTHEGQFIKIVENPQSDILPANFQFIPLKVTVDAAERIFVVTRGVFEGIMQFDETGAFIGYVGTIKVQQSLADRIWLRLATRAQRAQMQLYIPTEFSNVDIDEKGFIYATNIDLNTDEPIKRLNPSGDDVLKRFGYHPVRGEIRYRSRGNNSGPSRMVDIKLLDGGMYTALDSYRGRLFTYNHEGDLLYVFGGIGTQLGVFNIPVAVERQGENLLVLDRGKNNIVIFKPTLFGRSVNQATILHYNGNDTEAVEVWKEVIKMNTNYDVAYIGIGKSLLMEKDNKTAMEYFKLGMQRKYYSVAFKRYRKEVLQDQFGTMMTTFIVLLAAFVSFRIYKNWKTRRIEKREARLH